MEDKHREPLFDNAYAVVAAGGSTLLYAKSAEAGVFRRSLEGDPRANVEEMLVEDHVAPGGIAATKDGFFYIGHSREGVPRAIRFYDYATRKARDIWPVGPNIVEMLTVAPNGTELLYAAQDDSVADLELLDLE